MENDKAGPPSVAAIAWVLDILEQQLEQLDAVGARKAAAHLDAAIEQLRRDLEDAANHIAITEMIPAETEHFWDIEQFADDNRPDSAPTFTDEQRSAQAPEAFHIP